MPVSIILLNACLPTDTNGLNNTALTPSPQGNTPTVQWFPPTPTQTPVATIVIPPTPNTRPDAGDIILTDTFDNPALWSTGQIDIGSVAVENHQLNIVVAQQNAYRSGFRDVNIPVNAYVEAMANPNLCRGSDAYGILVRVIQRRYYFRLLLSCDGQVRLERVKNDSITVLVPWTPSGAVPPGAPSVSKLGIWMAGSELRFFINDLYQFSAQDASPIDGGVGFFAYSANEDGATLSFSDLVVREVSPSSPPGIPPVDSSNSSNPVTPVP